MQIHILYIYVLVLFNFFSSLKTLLSSVHCQTAMSICLKYTSCAKSLLRKYSFCQCLFTYTCMRVRTHTHVPLFLSRGNMYEAKVNFFLHNCLQQNQNNAKAANGEVFIAFALHYIHNISHISLIIVFLYLNKYLNTH